MHLDDIGAVVVEGPQLAVVPLVRPPEGVLPQYLVLLELGAQPPTLVVCQRVPVFLQRSNGTIDQTLHCRADQLNMNTLAKALCMAAGSPMHVWMTVAG